MAIVRCLIERHHYSAPTPSSDGAWHKGGGAVIGLSSQVHSYERSPDSRRPKADVEGAIRVVFFKLAASLCSPLRPCEDATVELCNTKALRLLRSRKRPENGAPGSLQRTADL